LLDLADVELAQLIATAALLPVEQRAASVRRVAAALAPLARPRARVPHRSGATGPSQRPAGGLLTGY
jgi:hypothetical protein